MKKKMWLVLALLLAFSAFPFAEAYADEFKNEPEIIYYEDGSYVIITVTEHVSPLNGFTAGLNVITSTKNASKTYTHYDSSGAIVWAATLSAAFTYNGTTSTCTAASCSTSIYSIAWYTVSSSTSRSGNTATANVTMGRKALGVTVQTIPIAITLSCDANGNLS